MADQGKRLDESTQRMIARLRSQNVSVRKTAAAAAVAKSTVEKYFPACGDCNRRKSQKLS